MNEILFIFQYRSSASNSIGYYLTLAYDIRPIFRIPSDINFRAEPPCGNETRHLACQILAKQNSGNAFLLPFDIDYLTDREIYSMPWMELYKHSPMLTIVRLCSGQQA